MKDYSKTIETERLILRKFKLSDAEDMFKNYCGREKVTEFVSVSYTHLTLPTIGG